MNVKKVKEIVKFDVERSIQNKWFVILNILMLISILIATNWSNISKFMSDHDINIASGEKFTIQVLDPENLVYGDIEEAFKDDENIKLEKVEENNYSKENIPKNDLLLLEVKSDEDKILDLKVVSKEGVDTIVYDKLYEVLKESRSKIFANKVGVTVDELEVLNEDLKLDREMLGVDAENSDTKEMIKLISTMIVYVCLIFVLSRIASEIANEKVSKSIEYVMTSVSAKEYLLAKVLSSTITIVIQLIYSIVYYMMGNMISSLFVSANSGAISIDIIGKIDKSVISYVLAMIGYLIFTVFLTALIQAALSSKTTSVTEAGNTTMLLLMVVVVLYVLSNGMINPYTKVTTAMYIVSCLPIVSTFFVPSMMIIGQATTLQIIISFVVLILSIPFIFNTCAKVFKNGILDYSPSKKKGLLSLGKKKEQEELTLAEKQDIDLRKSKAKKFAFTIGMALILFIILETITSLVLEFTLPAYLNGNFDRSTILVIENSITLIVSLGLASGFIKLYSSDIEVNKSEKKNLKGFQKFQVIFIGITIIAIIQIVINYLYKKFGVTGDIFEAAGIAPQKTFWGILIFVVGMALVPAIFEELLFRKWILNSSKRYGNLFAVVFSAVLFGIYHFNINQGIFAFLVGLLFGTIAVYTGGIKYTCLLHFLNNGFGCLQMILGTDSMILSYIIDIIMAISVIGIILILKNLPKLKNINKEDLKINKDCKYLLKNYTFVISMFLFILMFIATQKMLG